MRLCVVYAWCVHMCLCICVFISLYVVCVYVWKFLLIRVLLASRINGLLRRRLISYGLQKVCLNHKTFFKCRGPGSVRCKRVALNDLNFLTFSRVHLGCRFFFWGSCLLAEEMPWAMGYWTVGSSATRKKMDVANSRGALKWRRSTFRLRTLLCS